MNDLLAESLRDSMVNWLEAEDNDEDEESDEEMDNDNKNDDVEEETVHTIVTPIQTKARSRRIARKRKELPVSHEPIYTTNVVFPDDNNAKKRKRQHKKEPPTKMEQGTDFVSTRSERKNDIDLVKQICEQHMVHYMNSQTAEEQNQVVDNTLETISNSVYVTSKLEAYVRSLLTTKKFELQLHETDHAMVRRQLSELASERAKEMPPDTYKMYREIKSDPRCQSAFFPCGFLMNLLRAQQTEALDLFEEHFPRYYASGSDSKYVREEVIPRFANWYSYTLTTGFVELDENQVVRKILQKFRTMKKQSLAGFQAPKKLGRPFKRREDQPSSQQESVLGRGFPHETLHDQTPVMGKDTIENTKHALVCDDVGRNADANKLASCLPKPTTTITEYKREAEKVAKSTPITATDVALAAKEAEKTRKALDIEEMAESMDVVDEIEKDPTKNTVTDVALAGKRAEKTKKVVDKEEMVKSMDAVNEIKKDPRCKFAFFSCGGGMNKIRPCQVELNKLLEDHLKKYLNCTKKAKSDVVEKVIQQQAGNWYFFEPQDGFFVPTKKQLQSKIRQKFRDMKKLAPRTSLRSGRTRKRAENTVSSLKTLENGPCVRPTSAEKGRRISKSNW